jgi:hypothetical protein
MNIKTLKDYAFVRKCLTDTTHVDAKSIQGFIGITPENIRKLNTLVAMDLCSAGISIYKEGQYKASKQLPEFTFDDKYTDYQFQIELKSEKVHDRYFICKDWNTLLSYQQYILEPVKAIFFSDSLELQSAETPTQIFKRYQIAAKVCQLVKQVANDVTASQDYLIIFGQSLPINFNLDLSALEHDIDPDILEELLSKDLHKEAKTALVRELLVSFLKHHDITHRFSYLLTHFNAFSAQLLTSYEQYVSNYSFDKVRREYQEKKTEYIISINKVFDDVATKTFAIPAGVWLAASQIESAQLGTLGFYKNITFILIVFVLVIIVCFNLMGQFSCLKALSDVYHPLFERLGNEVGCDKEEVNKALSELQSRDFFVWWKLAASLFVTVTMFIIVIALLVIAVP